MRVRMVNFQKLIDGVGYSLEEQLSILQWIVYRNGDFEINWDPRRLGYEFDYRNIRKTAEFVFLKVMSQSQFKKWRAENGVYLDKRKKIICYNSYLKAERYGISNVMDGLLRLQNFGKLFLNVKDVQPEFPERGNPQITPEGLHFGLSGLGYGYKIWADYWFPELENSKDSRWEYTISQKDGEEIIGFIDRAISIFNNIKI